MLINRNLIGFLSSSNRSRDRTNSNMLNLMMVFTFSLLNWKHPSLGNQNTKIDKKDLNLGIFQYLYGLMQSLTGRTK